MMITLHEWGIDSVDGRTPRPPAHDEIQVWRAGLGAAAPAATGLATWLSPEEKVRAGRFRLAPARDQFCLGRAMVRCLLDHWYSRPPAAIPITISVSGKPRGGGAGRRGGTALQPVTCRSAGGSGVGLAASGGHRHRVAGASPGLRRACRAPLLRDGTSLARGASAEPPARGLPLPVDGPGGAAESFRRRMDAASVRRHRGPAVGGRGDAVSAGGRIGSGRLAPASPPAAAARLHLESGSGGSFPRRSGGLHPPSRDPEANAARLGLKQGQGDNKVAGSLCALVSGVPRWPLAAELNAPGSRRGGFPASGLGFALPVW